MSFPFDIFNGLLINPVIAPNRQDLLDFQGSGLVQSSRYINPITQDFEASPNGHFYGENGVDQQVFLALNTSFGTSAQNNFGQTFANIKVITPVVNSLMNNALNQALANLINANLIVLNNVIITQPATNMLNITFTYNNNTIGNTNTISFTLNNGIITSNG